MVGVRKIGKRLVYLIAALALVGSIVNWLTLDVKAAPGDQNDWHYVGNPEFSAGAIYFTSLVFNGDTPYIAYRDSGNGDKATVMKLNGSDWVPVGEPGFTADAAWFTSLAFHNGEPYLAFADQGDGLKPRL